MKSNTRDTELGGRATVFDGAEARSAGEECLFTAERYVPADECKSEFFKPARQKWAGLPRPVKDWQDFARLFADPWQYGIDTVAAMREQLLNARWPKPKQQRRRRKFSDADGEVDVDRMMAGDDAFMQTFKKEMSNTTHEILSLVTYVGGSCQYDAEDLFWQGAAAVALTDLLEAAGFSCENWVFFCGNDSFRDARRGETYFSAIKVKEAGRPVDTDVFAKLTSGWFFRMAVMGAFWLHGRPSDGYGSPNASPATHARWVDKYVGIAPGLRRVTVGASYSMSAAVENAKKAVLELVGAGELIED